ncbi:MAG: FkbM family methyltransferase [Paludisphaera borealis]|uniref:FkbM family methyltransferase n=1 Tax=Paludisphaera borealis TaxID=1387353 RepID=UPI00283D71A8|nr:FkbM family methyltransferase [Paludisphaera borealis]MDR3621067.1 FkbM family methyltransferase [Paludisphaera borealis]
MASDLSSVETKPGSPETRLDRWARKIKEDGIRRILSRRFSYQWYKIKVGSQRLYMQAVARYIKATGNRVKAYGLEFAVESPAVSYEQKYRLYTLEYEFDEIRLLKEHLDPSLPTVEFGGSIGVVACITNRSLQRPADHVVVEANPRVVPVLEENRKINDCRFEIIQAAVGYGGPTVDFYFGDNCMTGSTCHPDREMSTVPTVNLKSILDDRGFERINLIVDIEGAEIAMVANEIETIKQRVQLLIIETHERFLRKGETALMIQALENAGLAIVAGDRAESFVLAFRNRNRDAASL